LGADGHFRFLDMRTAHVPQAAGNHDGLVIAPHAARIFIARKALLEGAEVPTDRRPPKLVIEGSRADRPLDHDLQRRGDALRPSEILLPRALESGDAQVRDRKSGEPHLRLGAPTRGALVPDLTP